MQPVLLVAQNKECKTGRKASNAIAANRVKDTIAAVMFQLETYWNESKEEQSRYQAMTEGREDCFPFAGLFSIHLPNYYRLAMTNQKHKLELTNTAL